MTKRQPKRQATPKKLAPDDWQTVEHVVAAVERVRSRTSGMVVTRNAQLPRLTDPADTRNVDVLVEVPIGDRTLRIGLEVKGRGRPVSMDIMGSLVDLRKDVAVDRFCVVSASGFTKGAKRKAAENNIELETIEEFETSDLWAFPLGMKRLRSSGHIPHATFCFSKEVLDQYGAELSAAIANVPHDEILLMTEQVTLTATQVMSDALNKYLAPRREPIDKTAELRVVSDLSEVENLRMKIGDRVFPGPQSILAQATYQQVVDHLAERRFRLGNIEMSTVRMDGEEVSILAARRADGTTQLSVVKGPARPHPVRR